MSEECSPMEDRLGAFLGQYVEDQNYTFAPEDPTRPLRHSSDAASFSHHRGSCSRSSSGRTTRVLSLSDISSPRSVPTDLACFRSLLSTPELDGSESLDEAGTSPGLSPPHGSRPSVSDEHSAGRQTQHREEPSTSCYRNNRTASARRLSGRSRPPYGNGRHSAGFQAHGRPASWVSEPGANFRGDDSSVAAEDEARSVADPVRVSTRSGDVNDSFPA